MENEPGDSTFIHRLCYEETRLKEPFLLGIPQEMRTSSSLCHFWYRHQSSSYHASFEKGEKKKKKERKKWWGLDS